MKKRHSLNIRSLDKSQMSSIIFGVISKFLDPDIDPDYDPLLIKSLLASTQAWRQPYFASTHDIFKLHNTVQVMRVKTFIHWKKSPFQAFLHVFFSFFSPIFFRLKISLLKAKATKRLK